MIAKALKYKQFVDLESIELGDKGGESLSLLSCVMHNDA